MEDVALTNSILDSSKSLGKNFSNNNNNSTDSKETVFSLSESSHNFAPSARPRSNHRIIEVAETDQKTNSNNITSINSIKVESTNASNPTNYSNLGGNNKMYNKTQQQQQQQQNSNFKPKKLSPEELLPNSQNINSQNNNKQPLQTQQSQQQIQQVPNTITVSETTTTSPRTRSMSVSKGMPTSLNQAQNPATVGNSATNLNNNIQQNQTKEEINSPVPEERKASKPVRITSRMIFLKLGQVDTRNERYDAEAYIECFWEDDQIFRVLADPNFAKNVHNQVAMEQIVKQAASSQINANNVVNLKNIINNISILEYDSTLFWSPQLYIENAIGDLKEEVRYKLEIVEKQNVEPATKSLKNLGNNLTVRVCEMRKLRGVFYERLELYDFPMDTQELSITLTSKRSIDEVEIFENTREACSINTEDFLDQQEWDLFEHVKTSYKTINDPWRKYERSGFAVSSFIARKPGYYLYNAYMLIFLITVLGFVPFAFDPAGPQFRCQVTGLLLLTSVNFRWIVTQRLPSVPYLTSLDKYAIGSLLVLVIFCVWHSIIGSPLISTDTTTRKSIDSYVLYGAASFYILYNLFYVVWFIIMFRTIKKFQKDGLKDKEQQAAEIARENDKDRYEKNEMQMRYKTQANNNNNNNNKNVPNGKDYNNAQMQQAGLRPPQLNSTGMNNMIRANQLNAKSRQNQTMSVINDNALLMNTA